MKNNQPNNLPKLSAPAHRALASAGIRQLENLVKFSEKELKKLHGLGPSGIKQLKLAMKASGIAFKK